MSEFPEMEYKPIADGEGLQVPPDIEPLEFLMAIYRDHRQPMSRRMRAAIEAAQYRHPKLGAIATTNMNGQDFASLLERAILRSGKARELKLIEHRVEGERTLLNARLLNSTTPEGCQGSLLAALRRQPIAQPGDGRSVTRASAISSSLCCARYCSALALSSRWGKWLTL